AGFFIIGMLPTVTRHASPRPLALTLGIIFAVTAILFPNGLVYIHRVWMPLGSILGRINSKIILSLLFYLIVTPARLLMTLAGSDPMNRTFDEKLDTYRVLRKPREASHMKHQF